MLIANTTDQKFLEAILTELKKTNELLESLCSMRKDTEIREETINKGVKSNGTLPKSNRSNTNSNSSSDSPKRSRKRKAMPDSEHRSTAPILSSDNDSNSRKRVSRTGRTSISAKIHG